MMVALVKTVGEKMKGFSSKETVTYYEEIIKKAWQQVEEAETPEVRAEKYSDAADWTILDKDYETRTRRTFGTGPVFMPYWWWRTDPTIGSAGRSMGGSVAKGTSAPSGGNQSQDYYAAQPAWFQRRGICDRHRASLLGRRGRQPDLIYRRHYRQNQSRTGTDLQHFPLQRWTRQRHGRWWPFLRLCLCLCRVRLCLCRRRTLIRAIGRLLWPNYPKSVYCFQTKIHCRGSNPAISLTCANPASLRNASICAWKRTAALSLLVNANRIYHFKLQRPR